MDNRVMALVRGSDSGEFGTLEGMTNGVGDALRHTSASCQMQREMPNEASRMLAGHETGEANPSGEHRMDARNNAVGMSLASKEGGCLGLAIEAYRAGRLTTAPVAAGSASTPPEGK